MFAKAHLTTPTARGICLGWRERGDFAVMLEREKCRAGAKFQTRQSGGISRIFAEFGIAGAPTPEH